MFVSPLHEVGEILWFLLFDLVLQHVCRILYHKHSILGVICGAEAAMHPVTLVKGFYLASGLVKSVHQDPYISYCSSKHQPCILAIYHMIVSILHSCKGKYGCFTCLMEDTFLHGNSDTCKRFKLTYVTPAQPCHLISLRANS